MQKFHVLIEHSTKGDDAMLDVNKTVLLITGCIRPNLNALNFL